MATIYGGESPDHIFYLLVTGDRNWSDEETVYWCIRQVREDCLARGYELHVVHGDADGADTCARAAAKKLQIPAHSYPAPWDFIKKTEGYKRSRSAGPRRNRVMPERHKIDMAIAFHDDIDNSKGTADMISYLRELGIAGELISHDE